MRGVVLRTALPGLAKRGAREYGLSMETVVLIALIIVFIVALAVSPLARGRGDAVDSEIRTTTGVDVDKQFKRPRSEGGLLLSRERGCVRSACSVERAAATSPPEAVRRRWLAWKEARSARYRFDLYAVGVARLRTLMRRPAAGSPEAARAVPAASGWSVAGRW